jgi:hypothetical protein
MKKTTSITAPTAGFASVVSLLAVDTDHANLPLVLKNVKLVVRGAYQVMVKSAGRSSTPAISRGLTLDEFGGTLFTFDFSELDTKTCFVKSLGAGSSDIELLFDVE